MALCKLNFRSKILGLCTEMHVILPELAAAGMKPVCELPVLTLLHGLSDDATAWLRYTSVERYAAERGICVVLPYGARSFYVDASDGQRFYHYLSREIPLVTSRAFGLSRDREKNMIAGLSMGGYGAMRHALGEPDRYFAAGSFSGPLDIAAWKPVAEAAGGIQIYPGELDRIFGTEPAGTANDPMALLDRVPADQAPTLYVSCGTSDPLLSFNRSFAAKAGNGITYREIGGGHTWDVWDKELVSFLDFALK